MRVCEKGRDSNIGCWLGPCHRALSSKRNSCCLHQKSCYLLDPGIGFPHRRRLGRGIAPSFDVSVAPPFTLWSFVYKSALIFCDPLFLGGVLLYRLWKLNEGGPLSTQLWGSPHPSWVRCSGGSPMLLNDPSLLLGKHSRLIGSVSPALVESYLGCWSCSVRRLDIVMSSQGRCSHKRQCSTVLFVSVWRERGAWTMMNQLYFRPMFEMLWGNFSAVSWQFVSYSCLLLSCGETLTKTKFARKGFISAVGYV